MLHTVVGQQYPHTLSVVDQINTCNPMVHTVVGQQYPHTLSVVDQNSRIISIFWHQCQLLIHGYCLFVKQCFLKILINPSLPDMWILKCESYHYFYINTCNHMVHTVVGQQYPHTLSVVDQINTCNPMVHTVVGQQ